MSRHGHLCNDAAATVLAELVTAEAVAEPLTPALAVSQPELLDPAARARQYMARQADLAKLKADVSEFFGSALGW